MNRRLNLHADDRPIGNPATSRWLIRSVICSIIFAFGWAALTPVTESVTGDGRILPAGGERMVQTLTGGLVQEIHASEGQLVEQGALLVTFDRSEEQQQLRRLIARWEGRTAEHLHMRAIADGIEFEPPDTAAGRELYLAYQADVRLDTSILERLTAASTAAERQVSFAAARIDALRQELELARAAMERMAILRDQGAVNARSAEDAVRETLRASLNLAEAESQEARAQVQAAEAKLSLTRHVAERQSNAANRAAALAVEIAELVEEIERVSELASRDNVLAPVSGRIQNLAVLDPGQAILSGGLVAVIVPDRVEMFAEMRVDANRVGDVSEGLQVSVRVLAYDSTRFGAIEGEVVAISPTSDLDERGNAYFRVRIRLNEDINSQINVRPGLSVQADLQTGTKTVLEYFVKPIRVLQDRALSEA